MLKKTAGTSPDILNNVSQPRKHKMVARALLIAAMTGGFAFAMTVPAFAGPTVTTFTLTGGDLTLAVEATAALTDGAPGDATIVGDLGAVSVSDLRGTTEGWTVSAATTTFIDGAGSISTGVAYVPGTVDKTGTVTATPTSRPTLSTSAAVVTATAASGNNTATFTPTITVALPASALAGDYTGTITTSIL